MAFSTLYGFVALCYWSLATPVGLDLSLFSKSQEITIPFSRKVLWNEQSGLFNRIDIYVYSSRFVMLMLLILDSGWCIWKQESSRVRQLVERYTQLLQVGITLSRFQEQSKLQELCVCYMVGLKRKYILDFILFYFLSARFKRQPKIWAAFWTPFFNIKRQMLMLMYILDFGRESSLVLSYLWRRTGIILMTVDNVKMSFDFVLINKTLYIDLDCQVSRSL